MSENGIQSPASVFAYWDFSENEGLNGSPTNGAERGSWSIGKAAQQTEALMRTSGAQLCLSGGLDEKVVLNVTIISQ